MKRYLLLFICLILITGCGKKNEEKVIDKFINKVDKMSSYYLTADMKINSEEDSFDYDVEVFYLKDDFYKVLLNNKVNGHEQVILRNNEGVYVITPSLNRSFKFQSDWPDNSSQSYLLNSILNDIKKSEDKNYIKEEDYYVYKVPVTYPNNVELKYQKLFFDKDGDLKMVKVYNMDDVVKIDLIVKEIDFKKKINESDFEVNTIIDEDKVEQKTEETGKIEDIIYPLYIPSDTYLKSKEKILTDKGERVILTFSGNKNFVLVEEASYVNDEFEIIPVYGEPLMLSNTIGTLSANSLSWTSDSIDYYLTSNDLSNEELITVAHSLNVTEMVVGK